MPTSFGVHDLAIAHGDADIDRAIDDVVVGDDISVRRNDDAAADAVLDLRLRPAVGAESLAKARTEELLHVVRDLLLFGHVRFAF